MQNFHCGSKIPRKRTIPQLFHNMKLFFVNFSMRPSEVTISKINIVYQRII